MKWWLRLQAVLIRYQFNQNSWYKTEIGEYVDGNVPPARTVIIVLRVIICCNYW